MSPSSSSIGALASSPVMRTHHLPAPSQYRRTRLALICVSIIANGLFAGGIFTFPLIAPVLLDQLKMTQSQVTTIVLAGMAGQYPCTPLVGKIIDRWGPSACSFFASILFSTSFGLFALEIHKAMQNPMESSTSSFHRLAILFALAGFGTVFSYFSFLFAAAKNFPDFLGVASGLTTALFGLSPLFLSLVASNLFTDSRTDSFNVVHFLSFMAVAAGCVHLWGAFTLSAPASTTKAASRSSEAIAAEELSPLLPQTNHLENDDNSWLTVLRDRYFWLLAFALLVTLGPCEMVISNMGTIVMSLSPSPSNQLINSPLDATSSAQIRLLAISNTLTRLLVGPLADFLSPVPSFSLDGIPVFSRKHRISRCFFLCVAALLLAAAFIFVETGLPSQNWISVLSIATGIAYGAIFTVLPSILSGIWGLRNLGRNFGIITYAPFCGTTLFSYLYAYVSSSHSEQGSVCRGSSCWRLTFGVSTGASLAALLCSCVLWRKWKGKL